MYQVIPRSLVVAILPAGLCACAPGGPEVMVVHDLDEDVLVRAISFHGCKWDTVLAQGEATPPQFCLPGDDRIHFWKFDASEYCERQVEDGNLPDLCFCDDAGVPEDPFDMGIIDREPAWFPYRTVSVKRVDDGEFHRLVLVDDDLEQDFSTPGPYGH